jgi:integrase/recombinase XerD
LPAVTLEDLQRFADSLGELAPASQKRILPHEDVTHIIEREANPRNHAILWLLYQTGARVSEVCGLKWRDVQPRENGFAQVTIFGKGDQTRHVLISRRLYNEVTSMRGDAGRAPPSI